MDLNWLRDFECLARTLNFTRAADERNITQSAFSRRIKALETWVGLPLVNRAQYPIQLTAAGEEFLPIAFSTIAQLTQTRQAIRDTDVDGSRNLKISVLHTISTHFLSARIDALQLEIPELHTRVFSDSLSTCCDLLVEGAVEIMLCYYHSAVAPQINEMAFVRKNLLTERLLPVAASFPVRKLGWTLSDRETPLPYLAYERSSFLGMVVENIIGPRDLPTQTIYVDSLVETIKARVMRGSGFAWIPETAISAELANGSLIVIGDETWTTRLTIAALANPKSFDPIAQAFWDKI